MVRAASDCPASMYLPIEQPSVPFAHNAHLECTRGDQTRADDFEASSTVCFDIQSWRNGWKIERGLWFLQNKREAGNDCVLEAFASSKRLKHTATLENRNGNLYARHQDDGGPFPSRPAGH